MKMGKSCSLKCWESEYLFLYSFSYALIGQENFMKSLIKGENAEHPDKTVSTGMPKTVLRVGKKYYYYGN